MKKQILESKSNDEVRASLDKLNSNMKREPSPSLKKMDLLQNEVNKIKLDLQMSENVQKTSQSQI